MPPGARGATPLEPLEGRDVPRRIDPLGSGPIVRLFEDDDVETRLRLGEGNTVADAKPRARPKVLRARKSENHAYQVRDRRAPRDLIRRGPGGTERQPGHDERIVERARQFLPSDQIAHRGEEGRVEMRWLRRAERREEVP